MVIFTGGVLFYTIFLSALLAVHFIRLRSIPTYPPDDTLAVGVIVACKNGDDPHFADNLVRIIQQDYRGPLRFVFCVETESDPAMPVLRALERRFDHVQVSAAGLAVESTQKVRNILHGLAVVGDVDIYLIADADIHPHPTWLRDMIAPFQHPQIGAVTGYYRRLPLKAGLPWGDYLAGLFNAMLAILTTGAAAQALWGGSMAWRKTVMERYNLYETLKTAIVDDLALMTVLKQYRIQSYFAPGCVVKTYSDMSVCSSIDWLARQLQYFQVYFPALFWLLVVFLAPYVLLWGAAPVFFIYGLASQNSLAWGASLFFGLISLLHSDLIRRALPLHPAALAATDRPYTRLYWWLATPFAVLASGYALWRVIRRVHHGQLTLCWRGIRYQIDLKTKRVVNIFR